jgi:hypothetical protein
MDAVARAIASGVALAAITTLLAPGVAAAERAPRDFYGVVPQADVGAGDLERMGEGRVGTVRVTLPWAHIDRTAAPGDYDWSRFDAVVAGASRHGVAVLPTIYTVPSWVARLDGCPASSGAACSISPPRTQIGLSLWRSFVAAAVRRYGPEGLFWSLNPALPERPVRNWQVWNEPNSPGFFAPRPDVDAYAALLTAAAEAIRSVDERADVVLGGLYRYPLSGRDGGIRGTDFLERLYERPGIEAAFDGVAIHPYAARMSGVKAQVRRMMRVVRAAGDGDARIWITEIGWASGGRSNPLNRGRRGQAKRLEQAFRWFTAKRDRLGIRLVAWYAWRDMAPDEVRCQWCAHSGLFPTHGDDPKPAWERFVRFTGGR